MRFFYFVFSFGCVSLFAASALAAPTITEKKFIYGAAGDACEGCGETYDRITGPGKDYNQAGREAFQDDEREEEIREWIANMAQTTPGAEPTMIPPEYTPEPTATPYPDEGCYWMPDERSNTYTCICDGRQAFAFRCRREVGPPPDEENDEEEDEEPVPGERDCQWQTNPLGVRICFCDGRPQLFTSRCEESSEPPEPPGAGVEVTEFIEAHIEDADKVFEHYFDCADIDLIPFCYNVTDDGIDVEALKNPTSLCGVSVTGHLDVEVEPQREYWMPVQKTENVPQPFQSEYWEKNIQTAMMEAWLAEYYPNLEQHAEVFFNVHSKQLAQLVGATYGHNYEVPEMKASLTYLAPDGSRKDMSGLLADDVPEGTIMRHSLSPSMPGGMVYNDFHLMPEPTHILIRESMNELSDSIEPLEVDLGFHYNFYGICFGLEFRIKFYPVGKKMACHHFRDPVGIWNSDWPAMYLPSRQMPLSIMLWPSTMAEHMQYPMHCARKNMLIGDKSKNTPHDLMLSMNPMGDQALYGADEVRVKGKGCLGVGAGPYIPPVNWAFTPYHTNAAALGVIKSINLGRKMNWFLQTSGSLKPQDYRETNNPFYPFRIKGRGDKERDDKIQWVRHDRMPQGCHGIEQHQSFYGDANKRQQDDEGLTGIHWRFFRCCSPGFSRKPPKWMKFFGFPKSDPVYRY